MSPQPACIPPFTSTRINPPEISSKHASNMRLHYGALIPILGVSLVLAKPKNLIVDTDIFSDVDDAGALLLAATHPNLNLLAVNVNYPSVFSVLAASAILAHYGHPDCPIGVNRPLRNDTFFDNRDWELGEYATKIAFHWSGGTLPWGHEDRAWDPVELYRKTLSEAEDGSVTIASIGFLDNLSALLNSTSDEHSPLDGRALINRKVTELVVMGGRYPSGHSWNFFGSSPSSAHVINTWDGPITFLGDEVGENVLTGTPLMDSDVVTDPVRMAYIYYGYFTPRPSWDPLAIVYAATGLGELFELGNDIGYNYVHAEYGSNHWVYDKDVPGIKQQHFLRLKTNNDSAATIVNELFVDGARRFAQNTGEPSKVPSGAPVIQSTGTDTKRIQIVLLWLTVIALALALVSSSAALQASVEAQSYGLLKPARRSW